MLHFVQLSCVPPYYKLPYMSELTRRELSVTILSDPFKNNLAEITGLSRPGDPGAPPGLGALFAVHKAGGEISCAEVRHPDAQYIEATHRTSLQPHKDRLKYLMALLCGNDPGDLPDPALNDLTAKTNNNPVASMAVVAHAKPPTIWPTRSDLIHYGRHLQANPSFILGTAAFIKRDEAPDLHVKLPKTMRHLGRLTLLRPGDGLVFARLCALRGGGSTTEKHVTRIGLRSAQLTYNPDTGEILTGIGTIKKLYPKLLNGSS